MHREDYLTPSFIESMRKRYFRPRKLEWINPKGIAVLGIDLQRYFLERNKKAYLPSAPRLIQRLRDFYSFAKGLDIPIIMTRHCHGGDIMEGWWGDTMPCNHDTEIINEMREYGDEIVEKRTYDAFYRTDLENILREKNVNTVIITGVMTHLCCETSARSAFVHGLHVIFPIDGTVTQNSELHEGTIRAISHGFAPVPTLEEVKSWLKRWE